MLGIICSGQGNQHPAMFALTGELPAAAPIFAAATRLLGEDPRRLVRQAAAASLQANRTAQILCVTQALAAACLLERVLRQPCLVAGYSVGDLAAWGVAGALAPEATLELAARRAVAMDAASGPDEGLAHIAGLSQRQVEAIARSTNVEIAILNPGQRFILGGARQDLEAACARALAQGAARAGLIGVQVASHTRRQAAAASAFAAELAKAAARLPSGGPLLISGLDGAPVFRLEEGRGKLAAQIAAPISWSACLATLAERGATRVLELGPGRALAEMAAGLPFTARGLEDFRTAEGAAAWLEAAD